MLARAGLPSILKSGGASPTGGVTAAIYQDGASRH